MLLGLESPALPFAWLLAPETQKTAGKDGLPVPPLRQALFSILVLARAFLVGSVGVFVEAEPFKLSSVMLSRTGTLCVCVCVLHFSLW